jgi:hypothetical protein
MCRGRPYVAPAVKFEARDRVERGAALTGKADAPKKSRAAPPLTVAGAEVGPAATYKYRDPEKRRAYMRGYMAKKRGKTSQMRSEG